MKPYVTSCRIYLRSGTNGRHFFILKNFLEEAGILNISRSSVKVVKCGTKWETVPKWGGAVFIGEFQHSLDNRQAYNTIKIQGGTW